MGEQPTLLDYFAAHASEEDIQSFIPRTVGEVADLLAKLRWIKPRMIGEDPLRAYNDAQFRALRQWARYQHAKAMMRARPEPPEVKP